MGNPLIDLFVWRKPMVLLEGMNLLNVTFAYVVQAIAVVIILWEAGKKIMEIKEKSDLDHDRKQRWDKAADIVEKKEKVWDEAVLLSGKERQEITDTFNHRLGQQDTKIDRTLELVVELTKAMNILLKCEAEKGEDEEIKSAYTSFNNFVVNHIGK